MNMLSWILYFGDVAHGLSIAFGVGTMLLFVLTAILLFIWAMYTQTSYPDENDKAMAKIARTNSWKSAIAAFFLMIMSIIIPSKETIYMIAASQAGEQVMQTPTGTQISGIATDTLKLIQKYLNDQLTQENK